MRSCPLVLVAGALLVGPGFAHAQVDIVPRDSVRPMDTTPGIPRDSIAPPPPPAPAEAEVQYVVKPGDTLWGLARQFLRDPFRWQEVFQRNRDVVENPHRIYPGEVLRMPAGAVRPEALAEAEAEGIVVSRVETLPSRPGIVGLSTSTPAFGLVERAPFEGLRRAEVASAPFVVGRRGPPGAGRVGESAERDAVGNETGEHRFQLNEHAYIVAPAGVVPARGMEFLVLAEGPMLSDSTRVVIPTGILRVIEPPDSRRPTKTRLVRQFGEVFSRQFLLPYEAAETGDRRELIPVTAPGEAVVVWIPNNPVLPSLQHHVILSVPAGLEVQPGDRFVLVDQRQRRSTDPIVPGENAALVQVLRVTPFGATGLVIAQRLPTITLGMQARLAARLR